MSETATAALEKSRDEHERFKRFMMDLEDWLTDVTDIHMACLSPTCDHEVTRPKSDFDQRHTVETLARKQCSRCKSWGCDVNPVWNGLDIKVVMGER